MRQARFGVCSLIGLTILLLGTGSALGADYTVDPGESIQAAIDGAIANDTIILSDGIFNQNVNLNKAITLVSVNGPGATTIQGSAALATALGGGNLGTLCVSVNGVSIGTGMGDGLTIIGYDWASPAIEHAAIYLTGTCTGDLSVIGNIIVADGEGGLLDQYGSITTGNVEIASNIFSGKTYVGTTVGGNSSVQWTTPNVPRSMVYFGGNCVGINFHHNTVGGSVGAIIEATTESYYNTGATIDCVGATSLANGAIIQNNTFTIPSWASLRARGGFSTVTDNILGSSGSSDYVGAYYQNFETGVFANNQRYLVAGMTIQNAHDGAFPGDIINIPAGTYEEQVHITTDDLIFLGAGSGDDPMIDTIIMSPASLTWFYTTSSNNYPIVGFDGVDDVTVQNVRVDGAGRGNANYRFQGIGFWNSGGSAIDVEVVNVQNTPFDGTQHGVGVYAYNDTDGPYTINLTNVDVVDFQKGAIALSGTGVTANIVGCSTTGVGPTDITAQNGIQLYGTDGGTIDNCVVTGNIYTGEDWAAAGILLISAGNVALTDTDVSDGDPCIYCQDTSATADGMTITNNHVDSGNGFYTRIQNGITKNKSDDITEEAEPAPFGDYRGKDKADRGTVTVVVTNSTLTGQTTGYGFAASNYVVADLIDLTVTNCAIKNWGWGVVCYGSDGEVVTNFYENGFIGNDGFFYASGDLTASQNATGNYWGTVDAVELAAGAINGDIDYTPWLADGTENNPGFSGEFSIVYVDDDANPGASGLIQEGIDLVSGSTVYVAAGMYPGNLILPDNLNLLGTDGAALTTIAGTGGTAVTVAGNDIVIDGFTVTNPTGNYAISGTDRNRITVSNNIVTDIGTGTTTGYVHAVVFVCSAADVSDITIEDNVLHNIHADLNSSASAIAVGWTNGDFNVNDLIVQRNTIYNVRSNISDWPVGHGAYGILLSHGNGITGRTINPQILDNTIYDLEGLWAHAIGLEGFTPGAVLTGNTISNLVDHKTPSDAIAVMIENNAGAGTVTINDNSFTDLSVGVFSTNSGEIVNALGNYWGASSGPYNPDTNPLATGVAVGPFIDYDPWLGQSEVTADPVVGGPISCSGTQSITFTYVPDGFTPDLFLFDVTISASAEVTFGTITNGDIFNGTGYYFVTDNPDGSKTITASTLATVGDPYEALNGPHDLFTIEFVAASEGTAIITVTDLVLREQSNATIPTIIPGASILVDCTAPDPVTNITATPGHNKVGVSWTHDHLDVDKYYVYHAVWHDGTPGVTAYPEYDDMPLDAEPVRPVAGLPDPGQGWLKVDGDAIQPPVDSFFDLFAVLPANMHRGVYFYEVYAVDAAGNISDPAAANDQATNYWLGDIWGGSAINDVPNGQVQSFDINDLATNFGDPVPHGAITNVIDVGPTDDMSRLGYPLTDSVINFEDLMVFAMNFGVVTPAKTSDQISSSVDLAWVDYEDGRKALRLVKGNGLKGLRVRANTVVGSIEAGQLLDDQMELTFLKNVGEKLDVSVAVMGTGNGFSGTGDLFIIEAGSEIDVSMLTIEARAFDNSKMLIALEQASDTLTPRVFALHANYPNPFNPITKLSFSLPESQQVKLTIYGIDGRRVSTLVNEVRSAGLHEVIWDGTNDAKQGVASGTYFYRIEAGPYSQVHKMTLMK